MSKTKWVLDVAHSEMQFKIKHLMITNITGQFTKFEGTVETEGEDFTTAKARVSADISSISTNNAHRDGHLQSGDFFDTANHPQLTFESEKMEKVDEENYKLHGTLTMRGVSKKIVLDAELGGIVKDPYGNTKAGFTITGKINRKDFGVSFGMLTETGGIALGEEVKLNISAQFTKQVAS
ncbi:MAG: YceI family protein [Bacteroidia bacterium]